MMRSDYHVHCQLRGVVKEYPLRRPLDVSGKENRPGRGADPHDTGRIIVTLETHCQRRMQNLEYHAIPDPALAAHTPLHRPEPRQQL